MNVKNNKFLVENRAGNVIIALLENLILDNENLLAIYKVSNDRINKEGKQGFYDYVLILSDKRIIQINIDDGKIVNENYSLKEIIGFKIIKDYATTKERIMGSDDIRKIIILLRNVMNGNDFLEIIFDQKTNIMGLELQKENAFKFIKVLNGLIF